MTALISTPTPTRVLAQDPSETAPDTGSVTLYGVPWDLYCELRDLPDNNHKRMIYNHGTLVIMSPTSQFHEELSIVLNFLIFVWGEERNIKISYGRSMTFQRKDLKQGLEPDNCYYIRHAAEFRATRQIDLSTDPPPDLALEVDVTSPSDVKLPVYAALGVPEVWIWKANCLRPLVLRDGQYVEVQESTELPGFPLVDALRIMHEQWAGGAHDICREFRAFVRSRFERPAASGEQSQERES